MKPARATHLEWQALPNGQRYPVATLADSKVVPLRLLAADLGAAYPTLVAALALMPGQAGPLVQLPGEAGSQRAVLLGWFDYLLWAARCVRGRDALQAMRLARVNCRAEELADLSEEPLALRLIKRRWPNAMTADRWVELYEAFNGGVPLAELPARFAVGKSAVHMFLRGQYSPATAQRAYELIREAFAVDLQASPAIATRPKPGRAR